MNNTKKLTGPRSCVSRLVLRLFPEPPRWEAVSKGPANITGLRYKIEEVKIEGTYIKERNQHGEERYWITEPDGTRYMKGPESVIPENVQSASAPK